MLSAASLVAFKRASFILKPVQLGYPNDDDPTFVRSHAPRTHPLIILQYQDAVGPSSPVWVAKYIRLSDDHILCTIPQVLS